MDIIGMDKLREFIQNVKRNRKLKNYYMAEIKNGKSYIAILIDSLFLKILFSIIIYFYFYFRTNCFLFSFLITVQFLIIFILVGYNLKSYILNKKIREINKIMIKNKVLRKIKGFSNHEFVDYIKLIFGKYYSNLFVKYKNEVNLIGKIENKTVAIKCIKQPQEDKVNINDIKNFLFEMNKIKIFRGIIVTNSYFTEDLKQFCNINKSIKLINIDSIINILKEIDMYPTKEEIEEIILSRYTERKNKILKSRGNFLSKDRIIKYLVLGLFLKYMSYITKYQLYYKIVSIISFTLGVISIIYNIVNYIKARNKKIQL